MIVDKIWLERREGALFVTGYVIPELGVNDTMRCYVVVTLLDADGVELRSMPVDFQPRQIPVRIRGPKAVGRYSCPLDPLPPETAVVRVAASDNRPSQPQGSSNVP